MLNRFFTLVDSENILFQQAKKAHRLPNVFVAIVMHLVFMAVGLGSVIGVLFLIYGDMKIANQVFLEKGGIIAAFAVMVMSLWVWLHYFEKRSLKSVGFLGTKIIAKYLLGFGIGAIMLSTTVGFMSLSGNLIADNGINNPNGNILMLGTSILFLITFIVQGGTEEIITRGWFLNTIGARYRPWISVIVSSFAFAIFHFASNPIALFNLFLFGFFLALYCLREGSIWGVCGWHAAWNWTMVKCFGLSVSGHDMKGGTFLKLKAAGNPFLSGGDFGPEGSIYCTLIFVIGIIIVLLLVKPKEITKA